VVRSDGFDDGDLPEGTLESIDALVGGPVVDGVPEPGPQEHSSDRAEAARDGASGASARVSADPVNPPGMAEEPKGHSRRLVLMDSGKDAWHRLRDAGAPWCGKLETLLTALGAPVRMLPVSIRPYVDLLALTLVFWVPLIWLTAWILRLRG
jgi:hypothetical protein